MGKKNIALIVAGALLLVGIFSATAGGIMGGGFVRTYIDRDGIHTYEGADNQVSTELISFKNVDIAIHSGRVEMIKSDRNAIEYNLDYSERITVCEVIGDTFTFKTDWRFSISLFNLQESFVKLYYKDGETLDNVSLKTSSGSVYAEDITAKNVSTKSSSGSNKLSHINAQNLDISGLSGSIKLNGIQAENMNLKTGSGSIIVEKAKCKDITARNTSGSVKMHDVESEAMNVNGKSGSIYVQGILKGQTKLKTGSGSVKAFSSLPKEDYGYKLSSTSGSTKVDGETFKGSVSQEKANFIDASTISGSVKVFFNSRGE